MKTRVLIVEDSPSMARTYEGFLRKAGMETVVVDTCGAGMDELERFDPHAVLLDLHLPDQSGLKLLKHAKVTTPGIPIVAMTANGSMSTAIEAMREGAKDFLVKPFGGTRLISTLQQCFSNDAMQEPAAPAPTPTVERPVAAAKPRPAQSAQASGFVGSCLAMKAVFKIIEAAAPSDASVMITGESGTGKEVAATALHQASRRTGGPLVVLNCAAIPKDMLESEVFGHVKGAFTGAIADRQGAAERANGGTLFLDELGEMAPELQSKLLRFLQSGTYSRVGETRQRTADIRFVAATNRVPADAIREGFLREDLFFRLSVVPIHMPPLRERGADIIELAATFLDKYAREEGKDITGFDESAKAWLASQSWPGNVRELMNLVRRVMILSSGDEGLLTAEQLQAFSGYATGSAPAPVPSAAAPAEGAYEETGVIEPLALVERRAIERALAVTDGNIQEAARKLEINPSTIYRKRSGWGG